MYIGDKNMSQQIKKIKLGKKEKAILEFLKQHPEGVWKTDLINHFSWASRYDGVVSKRLYRLQQKGLIEIRAEVNPSSGRSKQRVYLKQ